MGGSLCGELNRWEYSGKPMARLYDVTVAAINQHLKKVFHDRELSPESVIKKYLALSPWASNDSASKTTLLNNAAGGEEVRN